MLSRLWKNSVPQEEIVAVLDSLGDLYLGMGDYVRASEYYRQALTFLEGISTVEGYPWGYAEAEWRIRFGLGRAYLRLGQPQEAVSLWKEATDVVESLRCWLGKADWMKKFMEEKYALYHNLVTTLATLEQPYEALFYTERAKARTLVDMMDTAMAYQRDKLSSELQEPAELVVALGALEAEASDPLAMGSAEKARAGVARAAQLTRENLEDLYRRIQAENPMLGNLLVVDPGRIREYMESVQQKLDAETVALEYFVTPDGTLLWVIAQEGIRGVYRIPVSRDELAAKVRAFRDELNTPPEVGEEATRLLHARELGRDLYQLLIAPVEEYLGEAKHLVIIPSDVLFYLPFGALVRCPGCEGGMLWQGEYLIQRYSLSYAPSLASLYWPFQHRGDGTYTSVLAVGANPDPKNPIPLAVEEAEAVAQKFSLGHLLVGSQATEEAVKELLSAHLYDVVHISTHGYFDRELPLVSYVQLLPTEGREDGNLYAGEILGLTLGKLTDQGIWQGCELVVLSACQTALPPELEEELVVGDELQGLSQALFVAGTPSAILSLWNVNDVSTRILMERMYEELMKGAEKGEALRRAQLSLLSDPTLRFRHPYFWAPFVLYGDWR
jgi:CHAT domain-containing protein